MPFTSEELFRLRSHAAEMEDMDTFASLEEITATDIAPTEPTIESASGNNDVESSGLPEEPRGVSYTQHRKPDGGLVKIFFGDDPVSKAYNEHSLRELKQNEGGHDD